MEETHGRRRFNPLGRRALSFFGSSGGKHTKGYPAAAIHVRRIAWRRARIEAALATSLPPEVLFAEASCTQTTARIANAVRAVHMSIDLYGPRENIGHLISFSVVLDNLARMRRMVNEVPSEEERTKLEVAFEEYETKLLTTLYTVNTNNRHLLVLAIILYKVSVLKTWPSAMELSSMRQVYSRSRSVREQARPFIIWQHLSAVAKEELQHAKHGDVCPIVSRSAQENTDAVYALRALALGSEQPTLSGIGLQLFLQTAHECAALHEALALLKSMEFSRLRPFTFASSDTPIHNPEKLEYKVEAASVCASCEVLEADLTMKLRRITDTLWISKSVTEAIMAHLGLPPDSLLLDWELNDSDVTEEQTLKQIQALSVVVQDLDSLQIRVVQYLSACKYQGSSVAVALFGKMFAAEDLILLLDDQDWSTTPAMSFLRHETRLSIVAEALRQRHLPLASWMSILIMLLRSSESELLKYKSSDRIARATGELFLSFAPLLPTSELMNEHAFLIPWAAIYLITPPESREKSWSLLGSSHQRSCRALALFDENAISTARWPITESVQSMQNTLLHKLKRATAPSAAAAPPNGCVSGRPQLIRAYIETPFRLSDVELEACCSTWNRSLAFGWARLTDK